jgi:cardiolipin synthase A/B
MTRESNRRKRNYLNQPYTVRNSVEWIQSGRNYFDRLVNLIDASHYEIHIQTYIFDSDKTGTMVAEALIRASKRNVKVFLLVDAYGSQEMSTEMINNLIRASIYFRKYGKFYSHGRFHIGRRMHNKICVIDGSVSVVGGINISDKYNDLPDNPAWLDFAVIMKGDISRSLQVICRKRWKGKKFFRNGRNKEVIITGFESNIPGKIPVRVRRNDFVRNMNDIAISYRETLRHSAESILLVGGYFLPGGRTRRMMKNAIQRGVKIDVVISEKSDVGVLNYARRYLYSWLIRNKIGVYEYMPSNVHGKVIIADGKWTSIGSYDLNNLSTYSNIELNVDINDAEFSKNLGEYIHKVMNENCKKITVENNYSNSGPFAKFSMWISYHFVKTLFVLSVILAGKKDKDF